MSHACAQPDPNQPIVNLEGELVALGPVTEDLFAVDLRWVNQFEMVRNLSMEPVPLTMETEAAWFAERDRSTSAVTFVIYERSDGNPIGLANLTGIDYRHGTANFGISIGEQSARGRDYGTEATRLILGYAFEALGLRNVLLTVFEYNLAGIRTYQKVGFREIGRRRKAKLMGDRFWDEIYMDCVAEEFAGSSRVQSGMSSEQSVTGS